MERLKNQSKLKNGEHYIEVNGIKHWYKIAGAEKGTTPIIIIHGGPGGHNYVFERTPGPKIEKFSTVIYYEQRGCGRSDAPKDQGEYSIPILLSDLAEFCEKLNIGKIIPLGFSFGGELALEFAVSYPELVERVIAQAPSMFSYNQRVSSTQVYGFQQVSKGDIKKKINDIVKLDINIDEKCSKIWEIVDLKTVDRLLFHNEKYGEFMRNLWQESKLVNTGLMMEALLKEQYKGLLTDRLPEIKAPVLIMTGLYDRNVGLNLNRDMASKISDCKFVIFDKSAHFPDIEESEKYANEVKKFILR